MSEYTVYGSLGSPYSLKVRAALRAKRLAHLWVMMDGARRAEVMGKVKTPVIPVIQHPDGNWSNDSTPFLLALDAKGEGRPLLPDDPADRFACLLIEDMADEWVTKAMFHYRWFYGPDADQLSTWLIFDNSPGATRANIAAFAAEIAKRQIGRMPIVGCTPETAPIIEASARRVLSILDTAATDGTVFLFGDRVSLADLGLYGQLWQLRTDPTPAAMMRADFPYCFRWLEHVDDASGYDGAWTTDAVDTGAVSALLAMAGDTYLPFLAANAAAQAAGETTFSLEIEGARFEQGVFGYQAKCLMTLRTHWAELDADAQARLTAKLGDGAAVLMP